MTGLTPRQKELYDIVRTSIIESGICPTYESIMFRMGLRSKSNVSRVIDALVDKGYLKRHARRAQSLILCKTHCPHCGKDIALEKD